LELNEKIHHQLDLKTKLWGSIQFWYFK